MFAFMCEKFVQSAPVLMAFSIAWPLWYRPSVWLLCSPFDTGLGYDTAARDSDLTRRTRW